MRPGFDQSPLNPLPPVVWLLVLPIIASEAVFALSGMGFMGGGNLRGQAVEMTAFVPDFLLRFVATGQFVWQQVVRIFTYPFVHYSFIHAAMVAVFALALGNMVAQAFRPGAVLAIFFASAIGAALVYTGLYAVIGGRAQPLVGGYPAVYGLVGAFTFLLREKLAREGGNPSRAFLLIGALVAFQSVFWVLNYTRYGVADLTVFAELSGFAIGFFLSFPLAPGGWTRMRREIRRR